MEIFTHAETWVAAGLILFFALLVVLKVPQTVARLMDARAAAIQAELDEAKRIREDAQALLEQLKADRAEAERQAQAMLETAEIEAKRYEAEAKARLEETLARREALAERKIATAEAQAAADVKAAAAELAAQTAEEVLSRRLKGKRSDPLVDASLEQLATRLR